jgi:hypothetical protein
VNQERAEAVLRRIFAAFAAVTALLVAAHVVIMLAARHEFNQVESVVGIHALMLSRGEGLYYDLQHYPFTVSPYGPIFYTLSAGLHLLGLPVLVGARLVSFTAFLGIVLLSWRLLRMHTSNRYAVWAGTLLIASAPYLVRWGMTGQVDVLALFFSVAALYAFSRRAFVWTGTFLIAAVFTKQTMIAAAAAIALRMFLDDRRRAMRFVLAVACGGATLALALNAATGGRYFENAVVANLNPMSLSKALLHADRFLAAGVCLLILALAGSRRALRGGPHLFCFYLGCAFVVFALTASKIGSEVNYQIETLVALGLCAGLALDRLEFFPLRLGGHPGWVTLLDIPLLVQMLFNGFMLGKWARDDWRLEQVRCREVAQLAPYIEPGRGRVLSVQIDPLLQVRGRIEVEPLIYTLLVDAGWVNPVPVQRDLAERRYSLVILYHDVFKQLDAPLGVEVPSLPKAQLEEIRKHYRLVRHIDGPYLDGDFLYEPAGGTGQ